MSRSSSCLLLIACVLPLAAAVREHPAGQIIPHDRFIRTLSEDEFPVERVQLKSKDGAEVAAAIRKPKGFGPFPALVYFHGAPGGRGIDKLVSWALGENGSPVLERFVREGFVVVVGDYRNPTWSPESHIIRKDQVTYVDDGEAVVAYARSLPYVDASRVVVYGVSLGGNVAAHLAGRVRPAATILGAPFISGFLGVRSMDRSAPVVADPEVSRANIDPISAPILILVGKVDFLYAMDRVFYDALAKAGKRVDMEVYENGYHDFCMGPQGHSGYNQPLMDSTLDALERTLAFVRTALER